MEDICVQGTEWSELDGLARAGGGEAGEVKSLRGTTGPGWKRPGASDQISVNEAKSQDWRLAILTGEEGGPARWAEPSASFQEEGE